MLEKLPCLTGETHMFSFPVGNPGLTLSEALLCSSSSADVMASEPRSWLMVPHCASQVWRDSSSAKLNMASSGGFVIFRCLQYFLFSFEYFSNLKYFHLHQTHECDMRS